MALHHGEVQTRRREGDGATIVAGSEAVLGRRAWSRTFTGQIWVTEEFRDELARQPSLWRTSPATLPGGEERVNAKRAASPTCGFASIVWSSELSSKHLESKPLESGHAAVNGIAPPRGGQPTPLTIFSVANHPVRAAVRLEGTPRPAQRSRGAAARQTVRAERRRRQTPTSTVVAMAAPST